MSAVGIFGFVISWQSVLCVHLCVCKWEFVCKGQRAHEDVQQERLPAPGTPSKTTRWGQKEKKTWKRDGVGGGGAVETREGSRYKAYGLCEETDVSVWRGEVSACTRPVASAIATPPPHGMNRQMCGEAALACWDPQSSPNLFSNDISLLLFCLSPSSPPLPHHASLSPFPQSCSYSGIRSLRLPFSLLSLQLLTFFLQHCVC